MTEKKVYSDEAIKAVIEEFGYSACKAYSDTGMDVFKHTAAMLQQLLNERDAVREKRDAAVDEALGILECEEKYEKGEPG